MSINHDTDSVIGFTKLLFSKPLAHGAILFWGLPCLAAFVWNLGVAHEPFDGSQINILLGHTVGWQTAAIISGGLTGADKEVRPQITEMVNRNPAVNNFNSRANSYNRTLSGQQQQR